MISQGSFRQRVVTGPIAVQMGPTYLRRLAHALLVLLNIFQDRNQPFDRRTAAGFAAVSQVDIDPFPNPFFHAAHRHLSQISVGDIDPSVPQFGGDLLAGLQIERSCGSYVDPESDG